MSFEDLIIIPAWDIYAFDRKTGRQQWTFASADEFPGVSHLSLSGGRIYAAGSLRYLYAIDAATGSFIWRTDLGERGFRPVVVDGVVYVGTHAEVSGGIADGHVVAVDAVTGDILWRTQISGGEPLNGGSKGPLAVTANLVIAPGFDGHVYALDRSTGAPMWEFSGTGEFTAGAVVLGDVVIVPNVSGSVTGLDVATGAVLWQTPEGTTTFGPITEHDGLAVFARGTLEAYDRAGTIVWQYGGAGFHQPELVSTPVFANGLAYSGGTGGFFAIRPPVK
ncbi:MAG TPA: PQQ-binding-like beta-propeller repeat protein [Gemmatimonadaceae bacterium]|nr:PQQ-binding-like beta-propeller repeat protein [Gemmatimonadaceae bacterium]